MALYLTFGGSPGLCKWVVLSEAICDLVNAIFHDTDWCPDTLISPVQYLVPSKLVMPKDTCFGRAEKQVVNIPEDPRGNIDIYIDNMTGLTVNLPTLPA
eukprot:8389706-Ditylum_brightwellii.AAC.1